MWKTARLHILWIAALASLCGCRNGGRVMPHLFDGGNGEEETWTIRCFHATGPQHASLAAQLADVLRQTPGLDPQAVRMVSDRNGSTVYYGRYKKTASRETGELVFPPAYRRDIAIIRQIRVRGQLLFSLPTPELIGGTAPTDEAISSWDVRNAPGPYTLQIGVFYNTPTFHQRKKAAEEYVRLLRAEGFHAYFYHEEGRSFVFVGDFDESDILQTPQGPRFGPRVEKLIAQREEEFRYILENGYRVRHKDSSGRMIVPPSQLVRVPKARTVSP